MNTILVVMIALVVLYAWGAVSCYFGLYKNATL
jgi:hypothetical protein